MTRTPTLNKWNNTSLPTKLKKKNELQWCLASNKTYGLLRNLCAPEKPSSLPFKDIVETLQQHLSPKPLLIAEQFCFHRRNQLEGETVCAYLAELRKLLLYCEFGTNLDDSLRDRLVCGLHNELIQKRLLSKPSLSLAKATEIALALEAAVKHYDYSETLRLQGKKESEVNKLTKGSEKANRMKQEVKLKHHCYQRGSPEHTPT